MTMMHLTWDKRGGSWKLGFQNIKIIYGTSKSVITDHRSQLDHDFDSNIQILNEE